MHQDIVWIAALLLLTALVLGVKAVREGRQRHEAEGETLDIGAYVSRLPPRRGAGIACPETKETAVGERREVESPPDRPPAAPKVSLVRRTKRTGRYRPRHLKPLVRVTWLRRLFRGGLER